MSVFFALCMQAASEDGLKKVYPNLKLLGRSPKVVPLPGPKQSSPITISKRPDSVLEIFDPEFEALQEDSQYVLQRKPSRVFEENENSDDEGMGERTQTGYFAAFDEQPVQPKRIEKISISDKLIPSVAKTIQDKLLLKFTGAMNFDEVKALLKNNGYVNYKDETLEKIAQKISDALKDLDDLADMMYKRLLQPSSNFKFRSTDDEAAQERYLKNYLWQNSGKYISDDLKQRFMNILTYKKLEKDELLKYAKKLYLNLANPLIDSPLSLKLDTVKETVRKYLQYSEDPEIVNIRQRLPMIVINNNSQAQEDAKNLIDWVTKKIALPVQRRPEDLEKKLQEQFKISRPNFNKQ